MGKLVLRHFEADGLATILDLGMVPDMVKLILDEGTYPDIITWFKRMVDDESIYGHLLTGSSGVVTRVTTAAEGIEAYDSSGEAVLIDTGGAKEKKVIPSLWTASTAYTARSGVTPGQVVRPVTRNGYVYECTSAGTTGASEPTWPTIPGNTVVDNGATWTCRDEKVVKYGKKGITIGASVSQNTNGNQCYVEAYQADRDPSDIDAGSVAASLPV
jgi:hypothetical protein